MKMKESVFRVLGISRYGGLSPFLRSLKETAKARFGRYDSLKTVDWRLARRLVFVCKGNICRSPYAEAKARSLGFNATSCGLEAAAGSQADVSAQHSARQRGMDLAGHRSRSLSDLDRLPGDVIVLFDPAHLVSIQPSRPESQAVTILGIWARPSRPLIVDPYGKQAECFDSCFDLIDVCLAELSRRR